MVFLQKKKIKTQMVKGVIGGKHVVTMIRTTPPPNLCSFLGCLYFTLCNALLTNNHLYVLIHVNKHFIIN